ncbi:NAD(P)-dependent oxidoreductase [Candidatus Desantisbacteria bacterium]|nr:NAD(P)-dependent oxidoreductase [Candidatus Desantisbacteria bacterium]
MNLDNNHKLQIAILGATSHIAKGLINNFLHNTKFSLHLFTKSRDKTINFLSTIRKSPDDNCIIHEGYNDFNEFSYNTIINCVGVGTINKLKGNYSNYFTVTEEYDNLIIKYLCNVCQDTLYISFSSGIVYGREHSLPVEENTANVIRVNHVAAEDYYSIVRLNSEAKHRSFKNLKIADLRLFSYFSRFIDLTDGYFITEIMNCILNKKVFVTNNVNIVRDYVHPEDLFSVVRKCMDFKNINTAFDVTSLRPAGKIEILDYFSSQYGLKYEIGKASVYVSATGSKNIYCSNYNNMAQIGHKPAYSSMDAIKQESKYILNR